MSTNIVQTIVVHKAISGSPSTNTVTVEAQGDGAIRFTDNPGNIKRIREENAKELFKTIAAIES